MPLTRKQQDIRLNKKAFWKWNAGASDRFEFFQQEARQKLEIEEGLINTLSAYNYHRSNRELETAEWDQFYRERVEQLFEKYQYLTVKPDDRIMGKHQGSEYLIKRVPGAYTAALEVDR